MNKFEIEPDVIISKLDIKDGDVITVTIDTDKWDLIQATEMLYAYKEIFPNNKVVGELKGMEISKSEKETKKEKFENELDKENNLWNIYYKIEKLLDEFSAYDSYSPYQEMLNKLEDGIEELYKYFGIRRLKIDIGRLKSGEIVQILQDEGGVWLIPLKPDKHDITIDLVELCACTDISLDEMFYE